MKVSSSKRKGRKSRKISFKTYQKLKANILNMEVRELISHAQNTISCMSIKKIAEELNHSHTLQHPIKKPQSVRKLNLSPINWTLKMKKTSMKSMQERRE